MIDLSNFQMKVEDVGLKSKVYPNNGLINVTDVDGTIQSFYTTTGTAIFRDGNDPFSSHKHTEKDMPFERFLTLCKGDEDILETFFN